MIKPTVGRVVWYHPEDEQPGDQPMLAMIAHVHSDSCVNLAIFDQNGNPIMGPPRSIRLLQEGEARPIGIRCCEWMPHQIAKVNEKPVVAESPALPLDPPEPAPSPSPVPGQ